MRLVIAAFLRTGHGVSPAAQRRLLTPLSS
jgi:hypothetical protein